MTRSSIFSNSPWEIHKFFADRGERPYRAIQLCDWLFRKRIFSLSSMSNLPISLREQLAVDFDWQLPEVVSRLDAADGATKLLLKARSGQLVETVLLRYPGRTALCVSSQVGCRFSCSFCQTGKLGFFRNLGADEIMGQFCLGEQIAQSEGRGISNVVFMGMGEPLDNFEPVVKTVGTLLDPQGFGLSHRRVTVSTSGIVPKIFELAERTRTALAVSLHACRDELRDRIMPINRRYPLAKLKDALRYYQRNTATKITFEYILIKDLNCSLREAKELVHFLEGIPSKINLIPFNNHPGLEYERPSLETITQFQNYLLQRGFVATVRYSKGLDVSAACGQLAAKRKDRLDSSPLRKDVLDSGSLLLGNS